MRTVPIALAAILVLALLAPLAEAQVPGSGGGGGTPGSGPGGRRGGERERIAADEEARDWANLSEAARERGLARAEASRLFSRFDWADGNATSRFVTFGFDAGSLADFSVRSANNTTSAYFSRVIVSGHDATAAPSVTGAVIRSMGNESYFAAHGNPLGLFSYRVRLATLNMSFELAEGAAAVAESARTFQIVASSGLHGHVILTQNATYSIGADNRTVNVTLGPHARLMFVHHAPQTAFTSTLHALRDGAAADRVGGILSVVGDTEGAVQDRIFLSGVAMRASHARAGRVDVVVSSENEKGRAVVVAVDAASVGLDDGSEVVVQLDGETIPSGASAADAMSSSTAVANVTMSNGTVQVIVAVPSFSDHTITIAAATTQPTPTGTIGTPTPAPAATPEGGTPTTGEEADNGTPGLGVALVLAVLAIVGFARPRRPAK